MHAIECAAIGETVGDVKAGTSQAGKPWLSFTIRVGTGDEAQWPRIAVFGEVAANLQGKLAKGVRVYVEGSVKLSAWQSGQGEARSGLSIAAKRCDVIGAIGRQRSTGASAATKATAKATFAPVGGGKPFDDELPF